MNQTDWYKKYVDGEITWQEYVAEIPSWNQKYCDYVDAETD